MGIFDRLSTLIKSNLNDLISSAENPEKMLNQIIVDMRNQLAKAKQQVAAAIADEKRLKDQAEAEFKLADDWEKRAMLAVQEGRDDLAKQALMRGQEHLEHGQQLAATWEAHKQETEKLKQSLRDLNDKIEEAKRKKNLLLARQRRAEAQARISQTMSGLSENSAFEAFARMEEKITANERQLQAAQEIDEEFSGDRLAGEFKQLERASGGVSADLQLSALKQRMGMLSAGAPAPSRQLGAGPTEAAAPAAPPAQLPASTSPAAASDARTAEADLIAEIERLGQTNPGR
ncbi:PspA/IM30 family protein [Gemmatimonas sp.]|jgi:phage shock protein A|uniref:PspA/IM30 family protein n=2 Tax=Gemmatimonas sp. TaxID=1962908 RepID=UPI0025BED409|nr:PspA/IM30 family protein [Gemmatimonas sp.]MCA2982629.1 PspA/IM30 family protein [Gemmatimonas sp.]MCA2992824.1 PspA/IM30 family protein [Gemmatimonas sp.]MCA2994562.1 PspA/IM30 family protein [Gemmatimonas sp.]MCE2954619.1 PspA/IM30 family protein [Gemmatimonas sp.]